MQCPSGTFASETLARRASRRRNQTYYAEGVNSVGSVMKRQQMRDNKIQNIEAADMEPLVNLEAQTPLICLPCHYTCATCAGPDSHHCTSCPEDATLADDAADPAKHYCYTDTILSQLSSASWHYNLNTAFIIIVFTFSVVILYFLIAYLLKTCCSETATMNVAYNKLALDEKQRNALDIQEELEKAVQDTSDSESEDDLNL